MYLTFLPRPLNYENPTGSLAVGPGVSLVNQTYTTNWFVTRYQSSGLHAAGVPVWQQCRSEAGGISDGHQARPHHPGQRVPVCSQRAGGLPPAALP